MSRNVFVDEGKLQMPYNLKAYSQITKILRFHPTYHRNCISEMLALKT